MSIAVPAPPATLDDLAKVDGKAELVNGRIIYFMPVGDAPSSAATEILVRLREYARDTGRGHARGDALGYALPAPLKSGRQSISPDASYYTCPRPAKKMKFVPGVPDFAVEVRSENDYGPKPEREMAEKRADYFEAGTLVVWDLDPEAETVTRYTAGDALPPVVFVRGQQADAGTALPGWTMLVDDIFA